VIIEMMSGKTSALNLSIDVGGKRHRKGARSPTSLLMSAVNPMIALATSISIREPRLDLTNV